MRRLAVVLGVLLAAGCGGDSYELGESEAAQLEAMMLRLSDLPEGFRYGRDRGCGEVTTTPGAQTELDAFLVKTRPQGCIGEFSREWGGEPREVTTALFLFDADEEARRAWELRRTLFEEFARIRMTTERGSGDAVRFDSAGALKLGAGEAWRDDRLVVSVYEEGLAGAEGRDFAAALASKQRRRVESPSDPAEEDDREIGLEDPAIAVPVYWLGREFTPRGLPAVSLIRGERFRGTGPEVEIEYEDGVRLELWKPGSRRGRARRRAVHFDDVVVVIKIDGGAYDSRRGVEAIVRGLRRR